MLRCWRMQLGMQRLAFESWFDATQDPCAHILGPYSCDRDASRRQQLFERLQVVENTLGIKLLYLIVEILALLVDLPLL